MKNVRADYMQWAKQHPHARWDLCGSTLLPCSNDDLPEAARALQINGPNDEGYAPLIEAIARRYGVATSQVATGTGTSGVNFLVCAALLDVGDEVLVETPGYDPLFAAPELLGARVVLFERRFEDGYALDPDLVARALTDRTRLIIITNLHNPSGVRASDEALAAVGRLAERAGAHVLVDEVYLDSAFADAGHRTPDTGRAPVGAAVLLGAQFISTSSLTKSYGLAGLRCGWALASPEVAERVRRARDIVDGTGVFPAERMAVVAFEHVDRLAARARAILEPNFALVRRFLDGRREIKYVPPAGGTVVFPRLHGQADAAPFIERLFREQEVGVVPGRFFQAPAHFRLAFGGPRETLECGLERIGRLLDRM
jgi:aspartate/methionine/tyrosine aminotransferase